MKLYAIALAAILAGSVVSAGQAESATGLADLTKALAAASKQGKLLFVQAGRPSCGNCQALRGYIAAGQVALPTNLFVYADVNIDDRQTMQNFGKHFKVEGNMLPFVVIADSDGKQLAARAGFGKPADFTEMIAGAEKKATKSTALKKAALAEKNAAKAAATNAVPAAAR